MMLGIHLLLCMLSDFISIVLCQQCLNDIQYHLKYYKIKKCHRSDSRGVVARSHFETVKDCMQFSRDKKGLAFNYSPPEARSKNFINCQVLGCPENNNLVGLENDAAFDYYSAYGDLSVLDNAFCIKSVGIFKLFDKKVNYTTAINNCQEIGADLANILTESRTLSMSTAVESSLTKDWYKVAYVGLDDQKYEGLFETALGESISCYKFRAWSPGHPRNHIKSDDCVVIDTERSWKVVNCRNELPYLCEFYSMNGSLQKTSPIENTNYAKADCEDLDNSDERSECEIFQRETRNNRCFN